MLEEAYLTEMRGLKASDPQEVPKPLDEGFREPGPRTLNFFFTVGTEPCGCCWAFIGLLAFDWTTESPSGCLRFFWGLAP
jgi:hypothetical protein